MITLELNETEKKILEEALVTRLNNLGNEISHTDLREYRDNLKVRREVLTKIKDRLH